jgi:hypothetical protein
MGGNEIRPQHSFIRPWLEWRMNRAELCLAQVIVVKGYPLIFLSSEPVSFTVRGLW